MKKVALKCYFISQRKFSKKEDCNILKFGLEVSYMTRTNYFTHLQLASKICTRHIITCFQALYSIIGTILQVSYTYLNYNPPRLK